MSSYSSASHVRAADLYLKFASISNRLFRFWFSWLLMKSRKKWIFYWKVICIFSVSDCLSRDVGVWKKKQKKTWVEYRLLKRKSISRNEGNSQRMGFGPFWKINKITQLIRIETNQEQSSRNKCNLKNRERTFPSLPTGSCSKFKWDFASKSTLMKALALSEGYPGKQLRRVFFFKDNLSLGWVEETNFLYKAY